MLFASSIVLACHKTPAPPDAAVVAPKSYALPGASGAVTLDLLAYDRPRDQVWIPVGETGSVDVFTIATSSFARVDGFKTMERESHGRKRMMGPSAAAVGEGFVYVSDRASNEVCIVDDKTLARGACVPLSSAPDVIAYVPSAKEVWVTTPKESSLVVFDASKPDALAPKTTIKADGSPECFAIDDGRGVFYTNLEDKNRTLAIDIKTHDVKASWTLGCKEAGPRGVAVDTVRNFLFVACTDGIEVLDAAHDGARLGTFDAGAGVDAIDYFAETKRLYVAAGKAARLTIAEFTAQGAPTIVSTTTTITGARNAVVDARGNAYVVDPQTARLLVYASPE
jgi:DNA-binding beta-propeller fold protein YncE